MKGKLTILILFISLSSAPAFADIFPLMQTNVQTKKILTKPVAFINYLALQRKISKNLIYKFHIKKAGKISIRNRIKPNKPFIKRLGKKIGTTNLS